MEKFDLPLLDVTRLGGHSHRRTWRFPPTSDGRPRPVGWTIISALKTKLESGLFDERLRILKSTKAKKILVSQDGAVEGVQVETDGVVKDIHADAVILATGGTHKDRETETEAEKDKGAQS